MLPVLKHLHRLQSLFLSLLQGAWYEFIGLHDLGRSPSIWPSATTTVIRQLSVGNLASIRTQASLWLCGLGSLKRGRSSAGAARPAYLLGLLREFKWQASLKEGKGRHLGLAILPLILAEMFLLLL